MLLRQTFGFQSRNCDNETSSPIWISTGSGIVPSRNVGFSNPGKLEQWKLVQEDWRTMIRTLDTMVACLLGLTMIGLLPAIQAQEATSHGTPVRLPTSASSVTVVHALPEGQRGADIIGHPEFHTQMLPARDGSVEVNVSSEPVWIIECNLPARASMSVGTSPFGFHRHRQGSDRRPGDPVRRLSAAAVRPHGQWSADLP